MNLIKALHVPSSHFPLSSYMHYEISPFPEESLFGADDHWEGRDLYRAKPAVSRSVCLLRRTARSIIWLIRKTRGIEEFLLWCITLITFISVHLWVTSVWTGSGHVITSYTTTTVPASFTIQAVCINITSCNIWYVHYKWNKKAPQCLM